MGTIAQMRMKPRILFNPSKYLEDVKLAQIQERKQTQTFLERAARVDPTAVSTTL